MSESDISQEFHTQASELIRNQIILFFHWFEKTSINQKEWFASIPLMIVP